MNEEYLLKMCLMFDGSRKRSLELTVSVVDGLHKDETSQSAVWTTGETNSLPP